MGDIAEIIDSKSNPNIIVLYHDNCLDGFGAAYAAWTVLGDTAEYIPVNYNEDFPVTNTYWAGKTVYLLDFCYKTDNLVYLCEMVGKDGKVIVIDHHVGALKYMERCSDINTLHNFSFIFNIEKCGCVLAWEFFHPNVRTPELLRHIQDGDLGYLWQDPERCLVGSKEIRAALSSKANIKRAFTVWHNLIHGEGVNFIDLLNTGTVLLNDFEQRCEDIAATAYTCAIDYSYMAHCIKHAYINNGLAVNATEQYASEVGNILAKQSGTYGAVWTYKGAGKYKVSLRSVKEFDVLLIAKFYGGGGHNNAAGFYVDGNKGQKLRQILHEL